LAIHNRAHAFLTAWHLMASALPCGLETVYHHAEDVASFSSLINEWNNLPEKRRF